VLSTPNDLKLPERLVVLVDHSTVRRRELHRSGDNGVEHGFQLEGRADRLADLPQRLQLIDRSRKVSGPLLQLTEQADVLDGYDSLIGEGLEQGDLLVGERSHDSSRDGDGPDGSSIT
jgi:hypothetical protein